MSAFALVSGALFRAPELKTAKTGKTYITATIKVAADNAVDFWSVLAFSESAQAELSRLGEGDKISVQGSFKVEPYTTKNGQTRFNRTLFADHVLALRQPPRESKPRPRRPTRPSHQRGPTSTTVPRAMGGRPMTATESTVYLDRDVAGTVIVERKGRVAAVDAAGKRLGTFKTDREAMAAILTAARKAREEPR